MANRRFAPARSRRPTFWLGSSTTQSVTTGAAVVSTVLVEVDLEQVKVLRPEEILLLKQHSFRVSTTQVRVSILSASNDVKPYVLTN